MSTELILIGPTTTLTQNVVYALPARKVMVFSSLAVEHSYDGTTFDALTNAETLGAETAAAFIRCTGGAAVVTVKA